MTVIYVPVKIESVEQAEALDAGTLLIHDRYAPLFVAEDEDGKTLSLRRGSPSYMDVRNAVGWTALAPIEAEEETVEKTRACQKTPDVLHRYVTGWQHYTAEEQP